ncbi:centrosomal protein of 162 kDa-like [Elysia marginata]|uniref:Centrosomal protein of 162 kDa n=1 Tax=Elysia marginata TaxID=1093978 RepID=A0AAV4EMT4_9GAST|nr:centrosomal protein of 162 kDa-like [Elysia marginata]
MAKSKRWSQEDLDSTFEAFLKTSYSSKDDTEKIKQLLDKPVKNVKEVKPSTLWWANDSDDDSIKKSKSKSFIKTKKPDSPGRSRAHGETKSKSNHNATNREKAGSPVKTSKQPVSPRRSGRRDPQKSKRQISPGKVRGSRSMSKDSLEDISEKSEEHDNHFHERRGKDINPVISIHDSSIDTSASYDGAQSGINRENPGFDTLDEIADKHNFFQNLEKAADGTLDYGKLNQELSQTGGTTLMSPAARLARADTSAISGSPADTSTPARPRTGERKAAAPDSSGQKPSMLSRVALMDSLESTFNTSASPKITNSREGTLPGDTLKTQALSGIMGTNTSREMEDLQRALQEAELTPTIYGGDSRPATAKTGMGEAQPKGGDQNQNNTTAAACQMVDKKVDRSVGDIFREMDAIEQRGRDIENKDNDVHLRSNYKSPRSVPSPRQRQHRYVDAEDENDHSNNEDTDIPQPVISVTVKERGRPDIKSDVREKSMSSTSNTEKVLSTKERYAHVQSSGYGRPTSPSSKRPRSRSTGNQRSPVKGQSSRDETSPRRATRERTMGASSPFKNASPRGTMKERSRTAKESVLASTDKFSPIQRMLSKGGVSGTDHKFLMQSMEAVLESYLKEHQHDISGDGVHHEPDTAILEEVKDLRVQLVTERNSKVRLQEQLQLQEESFKNQLSDQKFKYEEEVFALKQENFVLAAKLKEIEADKESKMKTSDGSPTAEGCEESRITRLDREIQEQENLLAGYQAENKRLYEEIKGFQKQAKATEGSMFKENQRLTAELNNIRQELEMKNSELQNKGVITSLAVQQQIAAGNAEAMMGASRVAHLEGELAEAKRVQENQTRELRQMQQSQFELERHVDTVLKEKDALAKLLADSLTPDQVKEHDAKHKVELEKLQKKIRWYAENQELLDKSNAKIRAKEEEIHKLKLKLEDFKSEAGRKLEENKMRNKEKAADAKKIKDLERQVKEMEQVIRRRHPNSLPAMMMVAAQAPDSVLTEGGTLPGVAGSGRTVQVLENRVKKLEAELESKDENAQHDLRAMEQKYNHVKLQFEERISDLEQQLSLYQGHVGVKGQRPHSHAVALERELDQVKDRARKQVAEAQARVDTLTAELNKLKKNQDNLMKNEMRHNETEWKSQISSLQNEVKDREQDIQILQRTVEKLRTQAGRKGQSSAGKSRWPPYPEAPAASKEYQPHTFTDSGATKLLEENQHLKDKVEQLQLELDQQRVDLRRSLAETELIARQTQESLQSQMEMMKSKHQQEVQRMIANQALHSSSSRVTELQGKCDTQEVMISHLKSQLKTASASQEELVKVKAREAELAAQVEDLQAKLREARHTHAPEMRHFESLEDKLSELVLRQKRREEELDTVVRGSQVMLGRADIEEELEKWKRVVDVKNQQLQSFRAELDSILEVLKTLQRQGITLPIGPVFS